MKMRNIMGKYFLCAACLFFLLFSCSTNQATTRNTVRPKAGPFFEGNGGKGIRIAVLQPKGEGLNADEQWLLPLIQGTLTGDFNRYSAMTVLDRQNLDTITAEQNLAASGYFSDDDFISIGSLTNTQYILAGSLTKTRNNCMLELSITDVKTGERRASFPPRTCGIPEIESLSAIKAAADELLAQMGVSLSAAGKEALHTIPKTAASAEAALSKGIVAQKKGTVVEAITYYNDAVSFDPKLSEANKRLSVLSSNISSGNIGENVRNDIQRRNEWVKILTDADTFFSKHLPFELVYSNKLADGKIDYAREAVTLESSITFGPTNSFQIFNNICAGLEKTGKRREWGLGLWPIMSDLVTMRSKWRSDIQGEDIQYLNSKLFSSLCFWESTARRDKAYANKMIDVDIALINEQGKVISKQDVKLTSRIEFAVSKKRATDRDHYGYGYIIQGVSGGMFLIDTTKLEVSTDRQKVLFSNVNANDITDNLTIKILSVDGIDPADNPEYIRITAQ